MLRGTIWTRLDVELAAELRDVDVVIGGGGDEILADEGDELLPGDEDDIFGEYPQIAVDRDGEEVPVVTTPVTTATSEPSR